MALMTSGQQGKKVTDALLLARIAQAIRRKGSSCDGDIKTLIDGVKTEKARRIAKALVARSPARDIVTREAQRITAWAEASR